VGEGRSGITLKHTGNVVLILVGLALVIGGVNNQAVSAVANAFRVQLPSLGAVTSAPPRMTLVPKVCRRMCAVVSSSWPPRWLRKSAGVPSAPGQFGRSSS
jgi:hypothetical protein